MGEPQGSETIEVINPATEEAIGTISLGNHADVDAAVAATQEAFRTFQTSVEERLRYLIKSQKLLELDREPRYSNYFEMGAPNG